MTNASTISSLRDARAQYPHLPEPTTVPLGDYRAELLGPAWFRRFALIGLAIGGLPRWHGKRFRADGSGVNLLRPKPAAANAALVEHLQMQLQLAPSPHDGRTVVRVGYDASARFPWPAVVDELRLLQSGDGCDVWLGMARSDWRWTRGIAGLRLPFLLIRES